MHRGPFSKLLGARIGGPLRRGILAPHSARVSYPSLLLGSPVCFYKELGTVYGRILRASSSHLL